MRLRYDWPGGTLETIDWEVHHQAMQFDNSRRTHDVKSYATIYSRLWQPRLYVMVKDFLILFPSL
jgi:hypothetical protein